MAHDRRLRAVPRPLPVEAPATSTAPRAVDAIVVGAGVAGLAAALAMPERRVLLVSKRRLGEGGSSVWAQGGVAVALAPGDSPAQHAADTVAVAGGLADAAAVALLTQRGPARVRQLLALGAAFDRDAAGDLAFGREAAHSASRILHAGGDATGAEMVRALVAAVRRAPWIEVLEEVFAEELLVDGATAAQPGRVVGLLVRDREGQARVLAAGAVVLATGGIGQLWRHTTNPVESTGDGIALAARAGAVLADLEMMQFHPTALVSPSDPLPLLTEALRGEGAILVDGDGDRFMPAEHPLAELAPRDVVARAIFRRRQADASGRSENQVFLDATDAVGERFPERFPTVFARCQELGFDPRVERLPVTPAAHYHMGGVAVDLAGRSSLPGLWACGEVASTGVHGANRLASNSLLEALVFGAEVGEDVAHASGLGRSTLGDSRRAWLAARPLLTRTAGFSDPQVTRRVRELMWDRVGVVRDENGLAAAMRALDDLVASSPALGGEARNLLTVARLVTAAALLRRESRGAHFRRDFPQADAAAAHRTFVTASELLAAAAPAAHALGVR